jgi:pimeloyl-ACP methyl ester carboxylesterase
MKRRWKVLIGAGVVLAVLLAINTIVVDQETKAAEVTVDGGKLLNLPAGTLQVAESGPTLVSGREAGEPIVLIHCYGCSLRWWDRLLPYLTPKHRVIRIDLLGFGGSEKPGEGYSIENEAAAVGLALHRLGVQGATVVGHSLGFDVTTALAAQSSELVDRVVNIDEAPDDSFGGLPLGARLQNLPVIGEASWRLAPEFLVKDGYGDAFAPGYHLADGFENPDQVLVDFDSMTYSSFHDVHDAASDYESEQPLDVRIRAALVPLLVIFGDRDQLWDDPREAADAYQDVLGAQVRIVSGAGHSPNIERPARTARLILDFVAEGEQPNQRR